jgi:C4-dicarboxylate-specific signal transduction histidine kinase
LIGRVRKLLRRDESKTEAVDLNGLVESTLRLIHGELVKRSINVETALAADLPAIAGDPVQLQQVLLNLLVNAMDAVGSKTPPRRNISVSTRAMEGTSRSTCGKRDRGGRSKADVRAVLHHQGAGTRSRTVDLLDHRQGA